MTDTSREAVEQINKELSWDDSLGAIELINALLAERDAALAEVARLSVALVGVERELTLTQEAYDAAVGEIARLSTPPDDVEMAGLVAELAIKSAMIQLGEKIAWGSDTALMGKAADAITRLSHALAAETAKREAMEAALMDALASLTAATSLLSRGSKKAAPSDKMFDQMVADYQASAERVRTTLAKHGSKP